MDASYTSIKKLRPFERHDLKIFVRIERLWEAFQLGRSATPILSMILIDKQGGLIHAFVPSTHFDTYKHQLREKQVLTLANFEVQTKDANYCPLNRPFKIKFRSDTNIREENANETFPNQEFALTDFRDLLHKVGKPAQLLDVIGLLIQVDKTSTTLTTRAGDSPKQDLFIRNQRGEDMRIAFWGKSLQLLIPLYSAPEQETVVVVTSLIAKAYTDQVYLQATYGTKIYMDFKFPQATALNNSPQNNSSTKQSMEHNRTIADIIALAKESKQALRATCIATISNFYLADGFCYEACTTCKTGVRPDYEFSWCFQCKKLINQPKSRLRIKFQISDETGEKDVSSFEETAQKLLDKSLEELTELSLQVGGKMAVKEVLQDILGRKLKFEIKIGDFNLRHPDLPFTASKFFYWAEPGNKKSKRKLFSD